MPLHKDITDPELHEPKGCASAAAGQVYVADGAGSGDWVGILAYIAGTKLPGTSLAEESIGTRELANGAVATLKIQNGAVRSNNVANEQIGGRHLQAVGSQPQNDKTSIANWVKAAMKEAITTGGSNPCPLFSSVTMEITVHPLDVENVFGGRDIRPGGIVNLSAATNAATTARKVFFRPLNPEILIGVGLGGNAPYTGGEIMTLGFASGSGTIDGGNFDNFKVLTPATRSLPPNVIHPFNRVSPTLPYGVTTVRLNSQAQGHKLPWTLEVANFNLLNTGVYIIESLIDSPSYARVLSDSAPDRLLISLMRIE